MCGYNEVELCARTDRLNYVRVQRSKPKSGYRERLNYVRVQREVELCAGTDRLNYVRVQTG